jgi:hypothetical protein
LSSQGVSFFLKILGENDGRGCKKNPRVRLNDKSNTRFEEANLWKLETLSIRNMQ